MQFYLAPQSTASFGADLSMSPVPIVTVFMLIVRASSVLAKLYSNSLLAL